MSKVVGGVLDTIFKAESLVKEEIEFSFKNLLELTTWKLKVSEFKYEKL